MPTGPPSRCASTVAHLGPVRHVPRQRHVDPSWPSCSMLMFGLRWRPTAPLHIHLRDLRHRERPTTDLKKSSTGRAVEGGEDELLTLSWPSMSAHNSGGILFQWPSTLFFRLFGIYLMRSPNNVYISINNNNNYYYYYYYYEIIIIIIIIMNIYLWVSYLFTMSVCNSSST